MNRFLVVTMLLMGLSFATACSSSVDYTPPAGSTGTVITHYSFGKMTIDGKDYDGDLAILPGGKVKNWPIDLGTHMLSSDDLAPMLDDQIKTVIIGTGNAGAVELGDEMQPLLDDLRKKGVRIFIENTAKAVKHFNATPKDGLLAAFHLNC
jgi:hypothetical protein